MGARCTDQLSTNILMNVLQGSESFQKPVSIGIVFKNVSSLNTPAYDMMQGTRRLSAMPLFRMT
jgi:hypothetical protein